MKDRLPEFLRTNKEILIGRVVPLSLAGLSLMGSIFLARYVPEVSAEDTTSTPTPVPGRVYAPIVSLQETRIAQAIQLMTPTTPTLTPTFTPEATSTAEPTATLEPTIEPTPEALRDKVQRLLHEYALEYGANPGEVIWVASCETGGTLSPWREDGSLRRGARGEVGDGQWLNPGGGNHWDRTPEWRENKTNILELYLAGHPNALEIDLRMLAWSFGREAAAMYDRPGVPNKYGWSCWRLSPYSR